MTLYCQTMDQLPPAMMARLGNGAEYSHALERDRKSGAVTERYQYRWSDFIVNLYARREPDIDGSLQEFIATAADTARSHGKVLDPDFVDRILLTRLVIGYDAGPDYQDASNFVRLESVILTLCRHTRSLLLWEGRVYDENMDLLVG